MSKACVIFALVVSFLAGAAGIAICLGKALDMWLDELIQHWNKR